MNCLQFVFVVVDSVIKCAIKELGSLSSCTSEHISSVIPPKTVATFQPNYGHQWFKGFLLKIILVCWFFLQASAGWMVRMDEGMCV